MADMGAALAGMGDSFYVGIVKIATGGAWVIGLVVVGVVLVYLIKFKHPLYLVFETSGGGKRFKRDRGWLNKKKNEFKALKNRDVTFPYPESQHEYIEGRNSSYIAVVRNQSASFLQITPNPHFIPANYDMREKLANDFKNSWSILKTKEGFWDKYGAQVIWLGSMGIFLIVIILILKRMDSIISLGNNVATAQIAANKQVINSIGMVGMFRLAKKEAVI